MSSSAAIVPAGAQNTNSTAMTVYRRVDAVAVVPTLSTDLDTVMMDKPVETVVPRWFADLFKTVDRDLASVEALVQQSLDKGYALEDKFPQLVARYQQLLHQQHELYEAATQGGQRLVLLENRLDEVYTSSRAFASWVEGVAELIVNSAHKEFESMRMQLEGQMKLINQLQIQADRGQESSVALVRRSEKARDKDAKKSAKLQIQVEGLEQRIHNLTADLERRELAGRMEQDRIWNLRMQQFAEEMERRERLKEPVPSVAIREVADKLAAWDTKSTVPPLNTSDKAGGSKGKGKMLMQEHLIQTSSGLAGGSGAPPAPPAALWREPSPSHSSSSSSDEDEDMHEVEEVPRVEVRPPGPVPTEPWAELVAFLRKERKPKPRPVELKAPPVFKGERSEDFRLWLAQVERFLSVESRRFTDDQHRISYVGSLLEGKALNWFEDRSRELASRFLNDNWQAYKSAMTERFLREDQDLRDFEKMWSLKYKGDIEDYMSKLESYNLRANTAGPAWKKAIQNGLPEDLLDDVGKLEDPHMTDLDYVALVRRCGRRKERREEARKTAKALGAPGPSKPSGQEAKSSSSSKKDKHKAKSHKADYKKEDSKKPGSSGAPKVHTDYAAAVKGISKDILESRKKKGRCLRCGKENHRWEWCRSSISTVKVAAAQPKKRKAEEPATATEVKKAKVAATAKPLSSQPAHFPRIAEVFEEELEEVDYEV